MRPHRGMSSPASPTQGLFSKDSSGLDTGGHLSIYLSGQTVKTRLQRIDNSFYVSSPTITADRWYHAAFTFGAGGMKLYLDGVLVDTHPLTGGTGTTSGGAGNHEPIGLGVLATSSGNLTLSGWTSPFRGQMEDVQLFGRALDAAEISRLTAGPEYAVRWEEHP